MKNILIAFILTIPFYLISQDTLVCHIKVYKDEEGNFSIEYGKDPKYSTKEILTLLSSYFKEQAKKEESPKIIKDL